MFSRKLSPAEKTLLVADWAARPFANQLVVEGVGTIDEVELQKAVDAACRAHPGSRLRLKGRYCFAKWVASGGSASVKVIRDSAWDGFHSLNAPFLTEPLHPVKGPTSQVVLLPGDTTRIVFRTNHGMMDGRGTQLWVEDVFAALNGKKPVGSRSRVTDMDISSMTRDKNQNSATKIRPSDCIIPTGKSQGDSQAVAWQRIRLEGKFKHLVSKLAILLAEEAWKYQPGRVSFLIPVDMRKRIPGLRSTNNLSSMIHFEVSDQDTVTSVQGKLSLLLAGQNESLPSWYPVLSFIPLSLMKRVYRQSAAESQATDLYSASAVISNLGKMPMERYACGGFDPEACFFIPPCGEGMSHFMTLAGSGKYVDILTATPHMYATQGRIHSLLASVARRLSANDI
ncbi:hypothetical protein [Desulfoluna sp.]|uniref:hypothetical protein n=1 Tax=Desulfoluna sp. TaxID=2045199 RepID=UPI002623CE2C|nr:hypothetical protein [Desulfoluna sp.]